MLVAKLTVIDGEPTQSAASLVDAALSDLDGHTVTGHDEGREECGAYEVTVMRAVVATPTLVKAVKTAETTTKPTRRPAQ